MFGGGAVFHAAAAAAALGQQQQHQAAEYGELGGGVGAAGFYESEAGGSSEPEPHGTSDRPRGEGGSGSKRTRAAEVHNLSEKRRRSRISEKMKALQSLIPSSNKTDKASMLDEAIEYLKQLQLQVQKTTARVRGTMCWFLLFPQAMACRWKEGEERGAAANHHALLSS